MSQELFDPALQARDAGAAVIDEPIINPPFDEPQYYWDTIDWKTHQQKEPVKAEGRRPAGYFYNPKGAKGTGALLEEEFVELRCVNEIRRRVREWREGSYQGATPVTRRLLEHWRNPDRELRLFFCQIEAVETLIWLTEAPATDRQGLEVEVDRWDAKPSQLSLDTGLPLDARLERVSRTVPLDKANEGFARYCCKMATGTGKTVVMAMAIAWQALNKCQYPQDVRFTDAFLVVGPGLTVRDRLGVLRPESESNYFAAFDLVPSSLRRDLSRAKICIIHRQSMALRDDTNSRSVTKLGAESDSAFANRLLKRELGSTNRILVINDEGHHCYQPRSHSVEIKGERLSAEEKQENERAAQWITGLSKISRVREFVGCYDFSATPFYIHGSGYPVGRPFPWIVSDFGLLDAIESGLVKIPQMPVDDNHRKGNTPAAYFHLWRWINDGLPPEYRYKPGRRGNAEKVAERAEPATVTMIGNWKRVNEEWKAKGSPVPPCMIVVNQDTYISEEIFKMFTKEDYEFDDFVNRPGREVSFLFDSKALKDVEKVEEGETVKDREIRMREILNSVGKEDAPGANVRFVSSVSMLTEGWDANNVTQIVGLRAFTSQLLCEQVVGRALRRRSYDVDPATGLLRPEYADIYGVPFQVIPVRATKGGGGTPPPSVLVKSMPEREAEHLIMFPRVEGYVSEVKTKVVCDWASVPVVRISKDKEPTRVEVGTISGYTIGSPLGAARDIHDRAAYYTVARIQAVIYSIASEIVGSLVGNLEEEATVRRRSIFSQVKEIVRAYVAKRVVFDEAPSEEVGLSRWSNSIRDALRPHIHASDDEGNPALLPIIERSRGHGTTKEVMFRTQRPVFETMKSHINFVVLDSPVWEKAASEHLEKCDLVQSYARNDHLDFTIPYFDFEAGAPRNHHPDFIARLKNEHGEVLVALEIKGQERDVDKAKKAAGEKWAKAVNNYYQRRAWVYHVCYNPDNLTRELEALAPTLPS